MLPPPPLPVECSFVRTLLAGQKAVTAEITPPVSGDGAHLLEKVRPLAGAVDAINLTDGVGSRSHMSALAASAILARNGIEPILQVTCRDRNRTALQSDLLGANALGVHNVVIHGGDDPDQGAQPDAKPIFDLDTVTLLAIARGMCAVGRLLSGRAITGAPNLFLGVTDVPVDPPAHWKPERLIAKAAAGAQFVRTQYCFDPGILRRYVTRLRDEGITDRLFLLIGTGSVASAHSARWMRDNLPGVIMPDAVIARLAQARNPRAEGQKICIDLIQEVLDMDGVAGVNIMAIRQEDAVPGILSAVRAGPSHRQLPDAPFHAH